MASRLQAGTSSAFIESDPAEDDIPCQLVLSYRINDTGATELGGDGTVIRIQQHLEARGYTVFVGEASLQGGHKWIQRLQHAVASCQVFIALCSKDYGNTKWTMREMVLADGEGKAMLPLWHSGDYPPPWLKIYLTGIQRIPTGKKPMAEVEFADTMQSLEACLLRMGCAPAHLPPGVVRTEPEPVAPATPTKAKPVQAASSPPPARPAAAAKAVAPAGGAKPAQAAATAKAPAAPAKPAAAAAAKPVAPVAPAAAAKPEGAPAAKPPPSKPAAPAAVAKQKEPAAEPVIPANKAAAAKKDTPAAKPARAPSRRPKLLDYVTVKEDLGVLEPGKYGIVLVDDRSATPFKVRSLTAPYDTYWYDEEDLRVVAADDVPAAQRLTLAPQQAGRGTPVTPASAAKHMLVVRGYDWLTASDKNGQNGEVGMLAEEADKEGGSSDNDDDDEEEQADMAWKVYWANGGEGTYCTGRGNKWELQHLQLVACAGAPVADEDVGAIGWGVVRSVHWRSEDQDGGSGTVGSKVEDDDSGWVGALWPNKGWHEYRAGYEGFELSYYPRVGEPVSFYNAQAGLRVCRGKDWKWDDQDKDGGVGVVQRPDDLDLSEGFMWWKVKWVDSGLTTCYRVGVPGTPCDLQVSLYDNAGSKGWLRVGCNVQLSEDYASYGDAERGPLKPRKVGLVLEVGTNSPVRYKVLVPGSSTSSAWWYDRAALRPLPSHLAAEANSELRLNRDGRAAFRGCSGGRGGDTGLPAEKVYYCGARMNQCRCKGCDGQCGPTAGCPCIACLALIGKTVGCDAQLEDAPDLEEEAAAEGEAGKGGVRLLDFVTAAPGYEDVLDARSGPLRPGKYGVVLVDDRSDKPLKVQALHEPYDTWWYGAKALKAVSEDSVPEGPGKFSVEGSQAGSGTPVTPHNAAKHCLVTRGYHWLDDSDDNGEDDEAGILVESSSDDKVWKVFWRNGGSGTYYCGKDNKFELQHLQRSARGGAPVIDRAGLAPGLSVTRGFWWGGGDDDGDDDEEGTLQLDVDDRDGHVSVRWPDATLCRYRASPSQGYELSYCPRAGEPVTLFNVQAGLRVCRGKDWKWGSQDGDGNVGTLQAPNSLGEDHVFWTVRWPTGVTQSYRVGLPNGGMCDLQVALYEDAGDSGWIKEGCNVKLAPDFATFGDAKDGPLEPNTFGVVVDDDASDDTLSVYAPGTSRSTWWYQRAALRPLPGPLVAAAAQSGAVLNRDGRAAFRGRGSQVGGDTGKPASQVYYCGAKLGQCRCGSCDGMCGPSNGCPCVACVELIGKRVGADGKLTDAPHLAVPAAQAGAQQRAAIRLFDYVTAAPKYEAFGNAKDGPLAPGKFGQVVLESSTGKPFMVRSLQPTLAVFWYERDALKAVPADSVPAAARTAVLPNQAGHGVPVSPATALCYMPVVRGYDWLSEEDKNGADLEVGTLAESLDGGTRWKVHWRNGGSGSYCTGKDGKFELQHLQSHDDGGAPVVADGGRLVAGSCVKRGPWWISAEQDGGSGTMGSARLTKKEGRVAARWPNGTFASYLGSQKFGYELVYGTRCGEPVTVFTAQANLRVTRGKDWKWGSQDGDGGVGILVRPTSREAEYIFWRVKWPSGVTNCYRVGLPGSGFCDLQVALYEGAGDSGWIKEGCNVKLAPDFANHSDASDGPLTADSMGVVVEVGASTPKRYKVFAPFLSTCVWWYDRQALRPVPGQMVAASKTKLKLNREGRAAFLGQSGKTGGSTGKPADQVYYCGVQNEQCRCGTCDGRCGPSSGCPCYACLALLGIEPDLHDA